MSRLGYRRYAVWRPTTYTLVQGDLRTEVPYEDLVYVRARKLESGRWYAHIVGDDMPDGTGGSQREAIRAALVALYGVEEGTALAESVGPLR